MPIDAHLGKYSYVSGEKFDDFLKALGVGMVMRSLANSQKPVITIEKNGDEITMTTASSAKTTVTKYKLGVPFDDERADGKKAKSLFTFVEPDKLVQKQDVEGAPQVTITRQFVGDELRAEYDSGTGVIGHRVYKK